MKKNIIFYPPPIKHYPKEKKEISHYAKTKPNKKYKQINLHSLKNRQHPPTIDTTSIALLRDRDSIYSGFLRKLNDFLFKIRVEEERVNWASNPCILEIYIFLTTKSFPLNVKYSIMHTTKHSITVLPFHRICSLDLSKNLKKFSLRW